ncbi:uncharacterized protein FOBCDRAFT_203903 [Fusarium oxysporum Fo47]|uniref:uncharacterized protein n=1 Tax=Fusarium oxysporum Fo47 TaxID=660027 RepID=UPI0028699D49|nr:uncharacterized protein FOBCDRAFT_203903 [Fusarium oxysporum Fo47]WJG35655.1 hypothetical protein FOBCDRAFT_203903 [Fusarium oxysporum Fo47]
MDIHSDDNEQKMDIVPTVRSSTDEEEPDNDDERAVMIILHEALRPCDGVEYSDHRVHTNTLMYMKDLKANNRRSWFNYFIFGIYRYVSFSKDQRPYKTSSRCKLEAAFGPLSQRLSGLFGRALIKGRNWLKQGYDANYVDTELLRLLKNEVVKKVHDEIFMAEDGQLKIIESSRTLPPFLSLIDLGNNKVLLKRSVFLYDCGTSMVRPNQGHCAEAVEQQDRASICDCRTEREDDADSAVGGGGAY